MAFRRVSEDSPLKNVEANSVVAEKFLESYKQNMYKKLLEDNNYMPSKSFAPSSIRCKRAQWFRLRGTTPDIREPDVTLKFIADIGTHCHENIQRNLIEFLGDSWIDVESYLEENKPPYEYVLNKTQFETRVKVSNPPVSFSCDGLVKFQNKVYLLEIKTSEANSMRKLVAPKPEHLDQIKCYCTLMGVDDALVLYQDRQYGSFKCFTYHLSEMDKQEIVSTFKDVQQYVERNMVPPALPKSDKWCNSSYCKYYSTCGKWGR